ncbi:hypothetical protein NMY22_g3254 [Coprinellus aureogranulatus]|nr:hypothetical protein NMY22_g3254 [Coprinellus aureogranulatus]
MLRTASVEHIDALNHHVKNTGVLPSGDGGEMEQAPSPPLFQAMVQRLYAQYSSVVGLVAAENSSFLPLAALRSPRARWPRRQPRSSTRSAESRRSAHETLRRVQRTTSLRSYLEIVLGLLMTLSKGGFVLNEGAQATLPRLLLELLAIHHAL